jgi:hypothetical protein
MARRRAAHLCAHLDDQFAVVARLDLCELVGVPGDEIAWLRSIAPRAVAVMFDSLVNAVFAAATASSASSVVAREISAHGCAVRTSRTTPRVRDPSTLRR